MKHLQIWIAILILWLIFLFNIERLTRSVDIRSYTYIFVASVAVAILILPPLSRKTFSMLLAIPVIAFIIFKVLFETGSWQQNLFEGNALPLTVTQVAAIIITAILARRISEALVEFHDAVNEITFSQIGAPPPLFIEKQGAMYNELKRARHYHRPLSVVALKIDEEDIQMLIPKIIKDVQQAMMREYLLAYLTRILDSSVNDFNTIARYNNHFIMLFPETPGQDIPEIIRTLEKTIRERLNIKLNTGYASFPDEAITFESLIELAVEKANNGQFEEPVTSVAPIPVRDLSD
jgi:hypothetical protein